MKKPLIVFTILLAIAFFAFSTMTKDQNSYQQYRKWFDHQVSHPIDQLIKNLNKKHPPKPQHYHQAKTKLEAILEKANQQTEKIPTAGLQRAHTHLLSYLKTRIHYYKEFELYAKDKSRDRKAQINNIYDEGNEEYQLFLYELEQEAQRENEKFSTPLVIY